MTWGMDRTPREFVDELGGYRAVAKRIGVSSKTMHAHASADRLPPRWYRALCELAWEKKVMAPAPDIFGFKPLVPEPEGASLREEDAA